MVWYLAIYWYNNCEEHGDEDERGEIGALV